MASPASRRATEMFNPPTTHPPSPVAISCTAGRSGRTDGRANGGRRGEPGAPRRGEGGSIGSTHPT
eukprot:333855-Pleurochrysis_carterae.AAC.1